VQFNNRALASIVSHQLFERFIERDNCRFRVLSRRELDVQMNFGGISSAFRGLFRASMIDEYPPHCPRTDGDEVSAILPRNIHLPDLQICFVDQRGRLKSMIVPLMSHRSFRNTPEFAVNERHQIIGGILIA